VEEEPAASILRVEDCSEEGVDSFLQSIDKYLPDHTVPHFQKTVIFRLDV
jgi:hypothetical protein